MREAKVLFAPVSDGEPVEAIAEKALALAKAAFGGVVVKGRPCAIKQHFGEGKNTGYIKPQITRALVDYVRKTGARPFVTDTNTLYRGRRGNAIDHLEQAREHGFTDESLGAPVVIADGLMGTDQVSVPIKGGKHFKQVRIASAGYEADSAIVLTHVKGHCEAGFAGSIKNVGMGFAARAGKLAQHHGGHPEFHATKCTACGTCVRWCPVDAVVMKKKATLLPKKCIGCGECYALCPHDAIGFEWNIGGPVLAERICEHVAGFLSNKRGRVGYLNFLIDVTKDCDCMGHKQKPEYPNAGILASTDIVAVEKATADLSRLRYGKDIWLHWWPESNYDAQFTYAEQLGLGTGHYRLVELD